MNKNKKGISLIVLVITIIVMIILAAAIILTLNESNIIDKAKEAVMKSDNANKKYVASIANAEWELMTENERKKYDNDIKKYVEDKLKEVGFKDVVVNDNGEIVEGTYTIYTDSAKKTAPIPNGFTVSTLPGETTIAGGLVIYEGTEPVTNEDSDSNGIIDAQETRNQFVWVPVDVPEGKTFAQIFQRTTTYKPTEDITAPDSEYTEPVSTACSNFDYDEYECLDTETLSLTNDSTGEWKEEAAMKASVEANGGFYIGRYEVGTTTEREYGKDNGTTPLVVQKDKFVYNNVGWGQSMTDVTGEVTDRYYKKNQGLGAVELSRNMYKKSLSVVSTLCYSVQWDAALRFIATKDADFPTNSAEKGNYTNNLKETGYYSTNNIYDMAGNVYEWTMEADVSYARVLRGGSYNDTGFGCPASRRHYNYPGSAYDYYGFRLALYIK